MTNQAIFSDKLAKPAGPFTPAIGADGFIFISGQLGQNPETGLVVKGGLERQADQALKNLTAIVEAAGKTLADVVRVGVYLIDMDKYAAMNGIYAQHFQKPYPARTTIAVAALPLGAVVGFDAVVRA